MKPLSGRLGPGSSVLSVSISDLPAPFDGGVKPRSVEEDAHEEKIKGIISMKSINAINLIDGLDGLSSGVSLISCISLLIIFALNGSPLISLLLT